jgi:GNAT superfamily N-acetyltransferase
MEEPISVIPFAWEHWGPLWQIRFAQLAEDGIILGPDAIPRQPADVGRDDPEWDFHHMAEVYLQGAGGFWLAWWGDMPVGYVGAQDLGGVIELRRMYVSADCRRRGIGTRLVQTLIRYCTMKGGRAVELWTADDGPGRLLYERLGFRQCAGPGSGFEHVAVATNYSPGPDELRMHLDLTGAAYCSA